MRLLWGVFLLLAAPVWWIFAVWPVAAIASGPSCVGGPCAWDETLDGPTPWYATDGFIQLAWQGGAATLGIVGLLLVATDIARRWAKR
jgi:hypothetical protein